MNEVVIYVKFITGTTCEDAEKAREICERMLVDGLEKGGLVSKDESKGLGLFSAKILGTHVEKM